jgi:regulator of cell morphogenesis and NO signaling
MAEKVVAAHGERRPEVVGCGRILNALKTELESHMQKEEQVLFPMIRELEMAESRPHLHCDSIQNPIAVMESEHDGAARALAQLRDRTRGHTPPDDACHTFRAWLDGLARLEADLHQHVHKENNILFPKVLRHEAGAPLI